jgi:hypothetical protein
MQEEYFNADDLKIGTTYNVVRTGALFPSEERTGAFFPSDERSAELTGKLDYGPSRKEVNLTFGGPMGFSILYNYDANKFWSYGYSDIHVFADSVGPVLKGGRKRKTRRHSRHRRSRRHRQSRRTRR